MKGVQDRVREEYRRAREGLRSIDRQTAFVLVMCVVIVFLQYIFGARQFFAAHFADYFPYEWREFISWVWWFGIQGIFGFVVPVLSLTLIFKRSARDIGLGLGDWKLASALALAYVPIVAAGTWVLSDSAAFQETYPHFDAAAHDWRLFAGYQLLFLFYWIGWEYLWRGFVLFGTAHTFGLYAIFVQMVPFAALHFEKPPAEAFLSIVGGLVLGALVWRCRAFWIAVPIHAVQMLMIDFWSTLRIRTEVDGIGPAALLEMLGSLTG